MVFHKTIRIVATMVVFGLTATSNPAQDASPAEENGLRMSSNTRSGTVPQAESEAKVISGVSQYTLGVADVIRVNVWKNTDISQTVTIGPDGFVSLPLLGDVHVAGMTTNQLALALTSKLSSYMVSPQVTVSVVEIRSRQVYVMGQVGKPGGYPLIAPITVLQLIAQAGGLNTFANRKNIYVLRAANGHAQKLLFNYSKVIRGDSRQNINLQPGDTVIVP